jgi:hypothetical protein
VRAAAHDAAQAHRSRLARVVRIAHVVLLELAGSPARHIQPAVVDGQVDVAHQRRNRAEGLERRWQLVRVGRLGLPIAIFASAQFVMVLDGSAMNVSISQIVAGLDTTIQGVQLAITA